MSEQIHGAEKIAAILHTKGIKASEKYVSEIMKEIGISSVGITAKQDYKKWEKEGTEIFYINNFIQTESSLGQRHHNF